LGSTLPSISHLWVRASSRLLIASYTFSRSILLDVYLRINEKFVLQSFITHVATYSSYYEDNPNTSKSEECYHNYSEWFHGLFILC
jgi:hypothetical protein